MRNVVVVAFFWIFKNILVIIPPDKAATLELHSASDGLAVPPRSIRTAELRRAGERTAVVAPPRRGGSVEIALPGAARLPPPLFLRRCPLFFFFRTPTVLNFIIAFGHLNLSHGHETTSAPASTASTTTPGPIKAASSRSRSPCAESATRALFGWPPAWRGIVNNCKSRPAREHCNQQLGSCSSVRRIALRIAAMLCCCTG